MKNFDYGVIGNCTNAALVDDESTIVWCCLPGFDSQAVIANTLDPDRGSEFGIRVDHEYAQRMDFQS